MSDTLPQNLSTFEMGMECPICFKDFNDSTQKIYQCQNGHTFCEDCFNDWIWLKKKKCSVCNVKVTQKIRNIGLEHIASLASKLPGSKVDPPSKLEKIVHTGVTCDGQHSSSSKVEIHGIRYKCNECPDYDLCSTCFNMGIHNGHSFMCFRDDQTKKKKVERPPRTSASVSRTRSQNTDALESLPKLKRRRCYN